MVEILAGGRLEGMDIAALRIDAGHDVLDGTVLARCVHRLEDEKHRPFILGIEHVLHLGQEFDAYGQRFFRALFVILFKIQCVTRVGVLEPELVPVGDAERFREFAGSFDQLLDFHD